MQRDPLTERTAAQIERYRTLSQQLAEQLAQAEERAARFEKTSEDLRVALKQAHYAALRDEVHFWNINANLRRDALIGQRARKYIAGSQSLITEMHELISSMETSKFWKLRNAWFAFKKKLGLSKMGAQPPFTAHKVGAWLFPLEDDDEYSAWLAGHELRNEDLQRLGGVADALRYQPKISVLVPVYNTPEVFLRAAIESVINQLYTNWELCIADDFSKFSHVQRVLEEYRAKDDRIKVVYRSENGHISRSSNSALGIATGDFVSLLDHDDVLTPDALLQVALLLNKHPHADVIYSDEDKIDDEGRRCDPYFKPDWSPDTLLSKMYIGHLTTYRKNLVDDVQGFRTGFEGSQDYDLALRITEQTRNIFHIPQVLYHWRIHEESVASGVTVKSYAFDAAMRAISEALERRSEPGTVTTIPEHPGNYLVRYDIKEYKRVSIIIPTRDHAEDVDHCLRSIFAKSTYPDFEVILIDNGSKDPKALRTFDAWKAKEPERFRVIPLDIPFNYSKLNNAGTGAASGHFLLFLNNDTEVVTSDWIEAMVEQSQRDSIGAVGALLLYADDTVQHAGVITRIGGVAGHSHKYFPADAPGYYHVLHTVTNYSAVTAACLMVRRSVFDECGGFDEELTVAFNDVDFCLKIRNAGYFNVYLPHVVLYHFESKSRGLEDTPQKLARSISEQAIMQERWNIAKVDDPFYSPHLSLLAEDFRIRT